MAEYPALPLFTDAYMADTRHLTTTQHGAYLLLLMTAWRMPDCKLPDDDTLLARWAGMDFRNWMKIRSVIIDQFWKKDEHGKLQQCRLLDERKYADSRRQKNSEAGKASALKRKNRDSTNVQPNCNQTSTPTPTPTPISISNKLDIVCETEVSTSKQKKEYKRATRLTEDWDLPSEWGRWAEEQGLTREQIINQCDIFKDYWISVSGARATKTDWQATWRNWIRRHLQEYKK